MTDGDLVVPVNMEDFTPVQTGIIQVRIINIQSANVC
jgi:hypothetical protein